MNRTRTPAAPFSPVRRPVTESSHGGATFRRVWNGRPRATEERAPETR